jgi:hypothetical protein
MNQEEELFLTIHQTKAIVSKEMHQPLFEHQPKQQRSKLEV